MKIKIKYLDEEILDILSKSKKPMNSRAMRDELQVRGHQIGDVNLRIAIKDIVFATDRPICSCDEGFYIATTPEEYKRGMRWVSHRLPELSRRCRRMRKIFDKNFGVEQPTLFEGIELGSM